MSAEDQIAGLAAYIMHEVPDEPSQDEGAGETAVRLLTKYRGAMKAALRELGEPTDDYPAPIVEAVIVLKAALGVETEV